MGIVGGQNIGNKGHIAYCTHRGFLAGMGAVRFFRNRQLTRCVTGLFQLIYGLMTAVGAGKFLLTKTDAAWCDQHGTAAVIVGKLFHRGGVLIFAMTAAVLIQLI